MSATVGWLRRQLPGIVALVLVAGLFVVSRVSFPSAAEAEALASKYAFTPQSIAMPSGFDQKEIRQVNQNYKHIDAWISSVGAGIAMNDLDSDGLSNDLCITDPRIDQVVVTPAPGAGDDRYTPFAVEYGSLPMTDVIMAPMGCAPGDFNEDGRMDLLIYFWGRTPVILLGKADATTLNADAYKPVELCPEITGSTYTGPLWNSNAVAIDDFDGDGHDDIYLGNYFPHSPVLDPSVNGGVAMNHSLAQAFNGGEDYIFRWSGAAKDSVSFDKVDDGVLPTSISKGWVLAAAANDIDGDQLPELYIAADHGPDALLYNKSKPGKIEFAPVEQPRTPGEPKSKRVGADSFKGMGIDFADFNHDGMYDMFISNITTTFGIQESSLHFMNMAKDQADLRAQLKEGTAPFKDHSTDALTAWGGWNWDVKMADFNNGGDVAIAQTSGFVKGEVNRWPQLQEMATANDLVLENPDWWPHVVAGDDIGGSQRLNFFVKGEDGKYANVSDQLGLAVPVPTRGIAVGDADGDGLLDLAVARQWDQPVFYHNEAPSPGAFLGLRLTDDTSGAPAVGTQVCVTTPDGRKYISRVDGGSGHSGKRSNEVHIGLGDSVSGPVQVNLKWRDRNGQTHEQDLQLTTGWHSLQLGSQAKER